MLLSRLPVVQESLLVALVNKILQKLEYLNLDFPFYWLAIVPLTGPPQP